MNLSEIVVFEEDFADLEVGTASTYPSTAEGEYHVVGRGLGRWVQVTIDDSWNRSMGPNWQVIEEDGRHVMAHTQVAPAGPPMLVRGDRRLSDYIFEADIRPLSFEEGCGLIVRYQNSLCYDAIRITQGQIALLHVHHGQSQRLGSRGYAFSADRYYRVGVECLGQQIRVAVDGEPLIEAREESYSEGKVGFWSSGPAWFADLRLATSREALASAKERAKAWASEEHALRQSLPQPILWKKISTAGFGTDRNLRFGDLDGDGDLEIVLSQRVQLPNGDFPFISCITAIDLDGQVMWQRGEPRSTFMPATSDNCFQVYDLDGDGCAEVLFCKDLQLYVADGKTGEIIRSRPTPFSRPSTSSAGGRPYRRINGDAIYICNLSGGPRPQEILIKDRYANVWALDADLNELWHHESNTGHFPASYDIDGDGREEVMAGYALLDHDGDLLWELPFGDHQDATAIGHFDPEDPDKILIAQAAGEEGFILTTAEGKVLAKHHLGHVQKLAVANVRPDLPGLEYVVITFWGQPGVMGVFNCRGELVDTFELVPYASALTPVNWSGTGQELLFLSAHPSEGGLIDGVGHRAVMFPDDGHPCYCCTALDLTGDGRDELVTWDTESIWIYRADAPLPSGKRYRPVRPPHYNESNYMAQVSLPHWEAEE